MSESLVLEDFLPYRLAVTAGAVSRSLSDVYAERFALSVAEWRIVANLGRFGAMTAGTLAERSTLDKPKVTRALARLQARRLVSRKTGREDRREVSVALTAAGLRLFAEISALARAWEGELLAMLSPAERAALAATLDKLAARARALRRPAPA